MPTWLDFAEWPLEAVEVRAPAIELAAVLRRYREDVDAAARASLEGRAKSLRALAEQAVLAAELSRLLEPSRSGRAGEPVDALHGTLRRISTEMLRRARAAGLEIVPLVGLEANAVHALADVEAWRYDDALTCEVVLEELEVTVLHHGTVLRRGRVVMGAPTHGDGDASHVRNRSPAQRRTDAPARSVAATTGSGRIICPVSDCATENEAVAAVCVACLTPLGGYARLSLFPRVLFNRGLQAARNGDSLEARECFAAVVLWHPDDLQSRNAYALACLDSRDLGAAGQAWRNVLARSPADPLATAGLRALGSRSEGAVPD
jgi:hypothetical protein